jgi:ankyrin repeat protein
MDLLIEAGCDIKIVNSQGIGPMYLAIKGNRIEMIRYLIGR